MRISIITLFPKIFDNVFSISIPGRAQKDKKIEIETIDLRKFGIGRHRTVDDKPYGGGTGMVLRADVLAAAIESVKTERKGEAVILLDPKGKIHTQKTAEKLAKYNHLIFVCARYEGVDERIRSFIDFEISIGDYILAGGEIPAMAVIESVIRLVPGILIKENATSLESHSQIDGRRILEYPHYTRPAVFRNRKVPKILVSGDFKKIQEYRIKKANEVTLRRRPDLADK